jgi:hypothetical protein
MKRLLIVCAGLALSFGATTASMAQLAPTGKMFDPGKQKDPEQQKDPGKMFDPGELKPVPTPPKPATSPKAPQGPVIKCPTGMDKREKTQNLVHNCISKCRYALCSLGTGCDPGDPALAEEVEIPCEKRCMPIASFCGVKF